MKVRRLDDCGLRHDHPAASKDVLPHLGHLCLRPIGSLNWPFRPSMAFQLGLPVRAPRCASAAILEVSVESPHSYRCCIEWLGSRRFHLMECGGTERSADGSRSGQTPTIHNLRGGRQTTDPWDRLASLRRFEVTSIGLESGTHLRLRTAIRSSKSGVYLWWFA